MSFCPILHTIIELTIADQLSASIRLPRHKRIHDGGGGLTKVSRVQRVSWSGEQKERKRAFSRFEIKGDRLTRGHSFNLSSKCWAVINGKAVVYP